MSIIEAASIGVRTMADGTLRLTVDIEPRHAQDAFKLFGSPGTPMALAALKTATHEPEKADKPKGGLLSQWAAMRCNEPAFREWLSSTHAGAFECASGDTPTEVAANVMRLVCHIDSRAELDHDANAADRFHKLIRGPWQKHCIATGAAA